MFEFSTGLGTGLFSGIILGFVLALLSTYSREEK